ncbi:hypothetical protein [Bdellovibrio sp. HCB2-146]|uniref:hypothetical protein n=1 Tax=Bdellovibrio sp. HCB2-146 TaxID=3394362 RepID=UPI0039BCB589
MALMYIDGFEGYASRTDVTAVGTSACRFTTLDSSVALSSSIYRTSQVTTANSRSLYAPGNQEFVLSMPSKTEIIIGCGVYITTTNSFAYTIFCVGGTGYSGQGIAFAMNPGAGTFSIHTSGGSGNPGTTLGTASGTYSHSTWYYAELRVKLGTTTGEAHLRINGVSVLSLTNINTAAGSISSYGIIGRGTSTSISVYLDDLYICDTSGSTNNTFLGPISVYGLLPTGAGSSTQMDAVGAASNWQAVGDATADTATYVETTVTAEQDYYTFQSLPAGITSVFGVALRTRNTTTDNGGRKIRLNLKNAANVISSTLRTLTMSSWLYEFFLSETAPDGSAWSKTSVDSTEAGIEAQ